MDNAAITHIYFTKHEVGPIRFLVSVNYAAYDTD